MIRLKKTFHLILGALIIGGLYLSISNISQLFKEEVNIFSSKSPTIIEKINSEEIIEDNWKNSIDSHQRHSWHHEDFSSNSFGCDTRSHSRIEDHKVHNRSNSCYDNGHDSLNHNRYDNKAKTSSQEFIGYTESKTF